MHLQFTNGKLYGEVKGQVPNEKKKNLTKTYMLYLGEHPKSEDAKISREAVFYPLQHLRLLADLPHCKQRDKHPAVFHSAPKEKKARLPSQQSRHLSALDKLTTLNT